MKEPTLWAISFIAFVETLVGAHPVGDGSYAEVEMVNDTITPEDVAAAIAMCTGVAESSTYSLSNGQSLDLTTVLKDMSYNGIVKGLELVDMATDTAANVVSLSLADVLSMPPTDGVYKLILSGAANDKVMLIPLHTSFFLFKINDLGTFLPNFPWFMSSSASRCWLPKAPEDV